MPPDPLEICAFGTHCSRRLRSYKHIRPAFEALKLGDYAVVLEPQRDPSLWDHYLMRNCGLNMVSNYMVTILGLTFSIPGVIKMTITKKILTK